MGCFHSKADLVGQPTSAPVNHEPDRLELHGTGPVVTDAAASLTTSTATTAGVGAVRQVPSSPQESARVVSALSGALPDASAPSTASSSQPRGPSVSSAAAPSHYTSSSHRGSERGHAAAPASPARSYRSAASHAARGSFAAEALPLPSTTLPSLPSSLGAPARLPAAAAACSLIGGPPSGPYESSQPADALALGTDPSRASPSLCASTSGGGGAHGSRISTASASASAQLRSMPSTTASASAYASAPAPSPSLSPTDASRPLAGPGAPPAQWSLAAGGDGAARVQAGTSAGPNAQAAPRLGGTVAEHEQAASAMGAATRGSASFEVLRPAGRDPLPGFLPPPALSSAYWALAALPPDTPVPVDVLGMLWGLDAGAPAGRAALIAKALASVGVLRVATLAHDSRWALLEPPHALHLAAVVSGAGGTGASAGAGSGADGPSGSGGLPSLAAVHGRMVAAYERRAAAQGAGGRSLAGLADDGYIFQALSHHLVGCGRLEALQSLLMDSEWLESKLASYGAGAVVRDFRRYLAAAEIAEACPAPPGPSSAAAALATKASGGGAALSAAGSGAVRLLLRAFQLSLGAVAEAPPGARLLREQMLARLMVAAAEGGPIGEWFEGQYEACLVRALEAAAEGQPVALMPRSPSLAQAGGVTRLTLRGHTGPLRGLAIAPSCCHVITAAADGIALAWDMVLGDCVLSFNHGAPLTAVGVTPDSASAVLGGQDGSASVWRLGGSGGEGGDQAAAAASAAGGPVDGRLEQRLLGHTARINAVAVDPIGLRLVTASADHTARVWSLGSGRCEAVLRGHGGGGDGRLGDVLDAAISADGSLAATASDDFTARVWHLGPEHWGSSRGSRGSDAEMADAWQFSSRCGRHALSSGASGVAAALVVAAAAVLEGHSGWVVSVRFVGVRHRVITASHDGTARVWDALSGTSLAVLYGHTGRLNRVVPSADGCVALTCSDDGTARLWDLGTQACVQVLSDGGAGVTDGALSLDCQRTVTASVDGCVSVWDLSGGSPEPGQAGPRAARLEGHTGEVVAVALTSRGRFAVSGGADGSAKVWDLDLVAQPGPCEGEEDEDEECADSREHVTITRNIAALRASAPGTTPTPAPAAAAAAAAAVASHVGPVTAIRVLAGDGGAEGEGAWGLVVSAGDDGHLMLWDAADGSCVRRLRGHATGVRFLAVADDGHSVVSGSGDRQMCRWDWIDFAAAAAAADLDRRDFLLATATTAAASTLTGGLAAGRGSVPTGPRGQGRVAGPWSIFSTWEGDGETSSRRTDGGMAGDDDPLAALDDSARDRGGGYGYGGVGGGVGRGAGPGTWCAPRAHSRLGRGLSGRGLPGPSPGASASAGTAGTLDTSLSGHLTAGSYHSGTGRGSLHLTQMAYRSYGGPGVHDIPQGSIYSGRMSRNMSGALSSNLAAIQSDPLHSTMPAQPGSRVKAMAFDATCRTAVTVLYDGSVAVWDLEAARVTSHLIKRGDRDATRTHTSAVNDVRLTRDGATAVTISKDNTARVWDVATGTTRHVVRGHTNAVLCMDLSYDESLLATACSDGVLVLSRLVGGAVVATLSHAAAPSHVAFGGDQGQRLAVALEDFSLVIWDLSSRRCVGSIAAHSAAISALAWSGPDARLLLSASRDSTARLWSGDTGEPAAVCMADTALTAACFAGGSRPDCVVVGDAAGVVHFLDLGPLG